MALNKKRNQRTTIEVWLGILLLAMSFCTISKQVVTYPIEKAISIVPNTVSVEHGLSQNSVTVMKLDSYSRLWVGTQEGLNLFDLNGVELVGQAPHLTQLSGRVIQGLAQDQRGNMWVATNRGLDKIKVSDLSVENILQKSDAGAVRQLDCMSDGRLVYLSDGVLYLLDPNTHQSTKLAGITGQAVYFFAYKDVLLVRLQDSIIAYNPNTQQSQAYPLQPDEARLALSFSRTQTGELLMLTAQNKLKACSFTRCREVVVQYGDKQLEFRRIRHFGDKFTAITNIGVVIGSADFDNLTLINTPFPDMLYPTFSQRAGIALRQDGAILIGNYRGVFEIPANYQSVSSFTSEQFLGSETIFATGKLETAQGERLVIAGESTLFITEVNREKLTVEQQFSIPQGMNGRHLIALNGRTYLASDNKGVFEVTIAGLVEVDNSKLAQSLATPLIIDMYAIDQHNTLILQNATLSKQSTQSGVAEVVWSVTLPTFSSYRLLYKSGYLFVATLDRGILYQQVEDGFAKPSQSWRSLLEHDIALDLYDVTPSQLLVMSVESGAVLDSLRSVSKTGRLQKRYRVLHTLPLPLCVARKRKQESGY
ncbi:two-component regulator propeller domain-containing protein [Pseudoalteromonas piscicida]|uniref:two-component regulator propeller domain-containing protein n=1 Tax=Pseudoalteromonas piscicida TaxID=43662 RepID=UPI0030B3B55E